MLSRRQLEAITDFLRVEHEFVAPRSFYTLSSNARNRMHAVSTIAKVSENPRFFFPFFLLCFYENLKFLHQ